MRLNGKQLAEAAKLFAGWEETMIDSCLQGVMGEVYAADHELRSAAAVLGDFCFLAGEPDVRLAGRHYGRDFLIMVPQHTGWEALIETVYSPEPEKTETEHRQCSPERKNPGRARRCVRYAFCKEPDCFDRRRLEAVAAGIPSGYVLEPIGGELYKTCLEQEWSRDLVANFKTGDEYRRLGLGFVILHDGEPVSGASSYSRCRQGIEIEIDTREDYRRNGLARICGAALILECLNRGLYPSWDAQNRASAALARQLGYRFSHEYPVYEVIFNRL